MLKKLLPALVFLLILNQFAFAIVQEDSTQIFAVIEGQDKGIVADLTIEVEPGTGKIWSSVDSLVGTSTQNTEKISVKLAREFFNKVDSYDYKFSISSSAAVVDGPSAGAAMSLLLTSMLTDKDLPSNVAITGTINEDGSIGPVGKVFYKAKTASEVGIKLFLIPKGEAIQTVKLDDGIRSVNLLEYAPANWGMKVAEAANIEEAITLAYTDVSELDVNTSAENAVPDFVPENLRGFKLLTDNYLKKSDTTITEAKNALSSTLIDDPSVTGFLLETINSSEGLMAEAEILNEQNYLYSAANFGFLSKVNAILVKEVALNPKLLEQNSSALDLSLIHI